MNNILSKQQQYKDRQQLFYDTNRERINIAKQIAREIYIKTFVNTKTLVSE